MTPRERTLAILLLGFILLGGGGALAYMFVYSPHQAKQAAAKQLDDEIRQLQEKVDGVAAGKKRLDELRRQSLPSDENLARAQYKLYLERLLRDAGITEYKIPESKKLTPRAPVVPELAPKKFAYTQLEFKVDVSSANMWQVVDFLRTFYQTELLHQITYINIVRTNKPTDLRNGLDVHLTIEAIILDGAENRRTLLPPSPPVVVPNAVAAVGGAPGLELVKGKPDLTRKYGAAAPVLATRPRDYSYMAWKDIFYGVLPPHIPKTEPPLSLGKMSDVTLNRDEKPGEARVRVSGEGSVGAKVTAAATGTLLASGPLEVDPKTHTITIPAVNPEEVSEEATSTVTVVAVSADGSATQKGSFKVTLRPRTSSPPPPGPDISAAIKMTILSGRSDGTRRATIFDAANPFKFEVVAEGKTIEVLKFWQSTGKNWRRDRDYELPAGVLQFTDDFSSTKRTFRVVAFEDEALILSESRSEAKDAGKEAPKVGAPNPKGGRPATPKQGPGDPLAAVAGNAAIANPTPVLYRWTLGKSLKDLTRLSPDEAKAIQKKVAANGPIMASAAGPN